MAKCKPIPDAIVQGDCLDVLGDMPNKSISLTFTSPPYEDARKNCLNLTGMAWVEWAVPRFLACLRVTNGLVAWVVEGRTRNFSWSGVPVLLMTELIRLGVILRKPPVFHRVGIPGSGGPDFLRNDYEFIICATNRSGKLPWSRPTTMGGPPKWKPGGPMSHRQQSGVRVNEEPKIRDMREGRVSGKIYTKRMPDGTMRHQAYTPPKTVNPGNVVSCIVGGGVMGSRLCHEHPAPFPEKLAEFFIRSFCPPGGIVLDPFCGSGTTLSVALQHGRRYIGIDKDPQWIKLSKRRVREARHDVPAV